jgi:bifunctional DNA-binding transcriptional regulator/antitoxin component of YhaV-PrlF toxin-antitoxin module
MKSTVTAKGHTLVPKKLRERFRMQSGTILDWQPEGDATRFVKLPVLKIVVIDGSGGSPNRLEPSVQGAAKMKARNGWAAAFQKRPAKELDELAGFREAPNDFDAREWEW